MTPIRHPGPSFAREAPGFTALADLIRSLAELRHVEREPVRLHVKGLAAAGGRIEPSRVGIPTVLTAEAGSDGRR
ncbi:MAG TPA: hypothetical protein PLO41_14630 [Rubrivivax sp.]|nr:hypothetical protein [Rubrivivax sp.]